MTMTLISAEFVNLIKNTANLLFCLFYAGMEQWCLQECGAQSCDQSKIGEVLYGIFLLPL